MAKKNKQAKAMELEAVKAVEAAPEIAVEESPNEEPKVDFEAWYALRKGAIPAVHKKEIIKADFAARKVPMTSSIAEFDKALKKYGVQLA